MFNTYPQQPVSNEIQLNTTTCDQTLAPGKHDQSILKVSQVPDTCKIPKNSTDNSNMNS